MTTGGGTSEGGGTTHGERRRLKLEKRRERHVWLHLGYVLFGITSWRSW
ncbi:hypothetical protein [Streptomyces albogriseolus]